MKTVAIITGDIVNSREIEDKDLFLSYLKLIFSQIESKISFKKPFEIYRGDSFQAMVENPKDAVLVAILLRTGLRSLNVNQKQKELPLEQLKDARISIGIGKMNFIDKSITSSDGEAFVLSGEGLDSMKKSDERLKIVVKNDELLDIFNVTTTLATTIINKWSNYAAETMYRHLLYNETQKEMAKALNISQPAVHKRKAAANADAIDLYVSFITKLIQKNYG